MLRLLKKSFLILVAVLMLISGGSGLINGQAKRRYCYHTKRVLHRKYIRSSKTKINRYRSHRNARFNWRSYVYNVKSRAALDQITQNYSKKYHQAVERFLDSQDPTQNYPDSNVYIGATLKQYSYNGQTIPAFDGDSGFFIPVKYAVWYNRHYHSSMRRFFKKHQISKGKLYQDHNSRETSNQTVIYYKPSMIKHLAKLYHVSFHQYVTQHLNDRESIPTKVQPNYQNIIDQLTQPVNG